MGKQSFLIGLVFLILASCSASKESGYAFVNGQWFDGEAFQKKTFYSVDGKLCENPPAQIDSVVDLAGGYVIPPFGEAHTHLLSQNEKLDEQIRMFLREGVFYAMNQDPIYTLTPEVLHEIDQPETVDVIYTRGVVTASWNIVAGLYKTLAEQGMFGKGKTLQDLDTKNFFLIDSLENLRQKWGRLSAINDHFIKIVIAFTEEQEKRKQNPEYDFELGSYSQTPGIDPKLLPELVQRAHGEGLRTSVHIETAADFHLAVASSTDFIAHLPASWQIGKKTGFLDDSDDRWLISEQDAEKAARNNTTVITTAFPPPNTANWDRFKRVHSKNLSLLREFEVPLVLGSDLFNKTVQSEALYLWELGVFENRELLNLLSRDTPQAIFPNRKIGVLDNNYEASFLVLKGDPLENFDHIQTITMRVKEGHVLNLNL